MLKNNTIEKEEKIELKEKKEELKIENNNKDFHIVETKNNNSNIIQTFGIYAIFFIVILLLSFILFTINTAKNQKMFPKIFISGYNISNQTKEEALNNLNNYITNNIPEEIKLTHNGFETSLSPKDLGITFDTSSAINLAYQYGRTGTLLENDIIRLKSFFSNTKIEPLFTIDEDLLKNNLKDISKKLPDAVIQSSYYIEDNNLILTKGKKGSVIDIDKSSNLIIENIKNLKLLDKPIELITTSVTPKKLDIDLIYNEIHKEPKNAYFTQNPYAVFPSENGLDFGIPLAEVKENLENTNEELKVPLKVLYPKVTTNMIGREAFPNILSSFSTSYSARNKNRTTNLILASNKINGTVLMPGETFSYNKVVGQRTIAAGYKEAPIYVSGKVVDGLGGGICQITSTLYNAALLADLEITKRSNHQFVPSYVRASRDATVVYGSIDFQFKNNRNYPIKIQSSVSRGIARIEILGLKQENDFQIEIHDKITKTTKNSIYSEAYKIKKKNGQTISSSLISKDIYKKH